MKSNGIHYKLLSQQIEPEAAASSSPKSWWCPKLTRLKLISVSVIFLCTVVFLCYKALSPVLLHGAEPVLFATLPVSASDYGIPPTFTTTETFVVDRIRYKHTKRRLPWCIIIGVRKAGTRALLTFLDLHPQIRTARNEVHFFDNDDNYAMGLEWYRRKMPYSFSDQITIEKSPAYFVCDYTPKRVFEMNNTIKLLLIVRDPVPRTVSDYLQIHVKRLGLGKMHDTFENLVIDPNTGDIDPSYRPIQRSLYYRYMRRWLNWFQMDQIHIVDGDKMVQDPVTELHKVERSVKFYQ